MRETRGKPAYYLVLVVYALIIGGLLYREFGETRPVRYTLGEISISARQSAGVTGNLLAGKGSAYRSFTLKYRSFSLDFPENGAGVLIHVDGSESQASVSRISRSSSSMQINFLSGISFTITETDKNDAGYTMSIDFSAVKDETITGMRLPWTGSEASVHAGLPILRASRTGSSGGVAAFGPYCRVSDSIISIPRMNEPQEVRFLNPKDDESLIRVWGDIHHLPANEESLKAALAQLAQTAYEGWEKDRWLDDAGSWEYAADAPGEGTTASAMLLESLYRGTYLQTRNRLVGGSPRLIDRTSALYLGSAVNPLRSFGETVESFTRETVSRATDGNPEVFSNPEMLQICLSSGVPEISAAISSLEETAEKVILEEPEDDNAFSLTLNAGEFLLSRGNEDNPAVRFLIREILLPRICPTGIDSYGIHLSEGSDTRINIKAGKLMLESNDSLTRSIGYSLLLSAVRSAGEYGRLPAGFEMGEFYTRESESVLEPETFEDLLRMYRESSYTPRVIDLGAGREWMWTTAANVRFQPGNTSVLSFQFPQGGIHHFALFNVEPFDQIQMHGIPWKSDPEFQRYSDGWVYDVRSKTLYFKIRHRATRQEIRIIRNLQPAASE